MLLTPLPPSRILAVDDVPDNLFLIEGILEEENYEIQCVASGAEALKAIDQNPPDLILLDIMMPDMDGYEVTRKIRQNPKLPYIPILLITAHDQSSLVEGLDAGADDFVRKPVDPDELLARARSLLRLKHSIDEREAAILQREDFVSRLTHDLRTPLVAADRMLQLFIQEAFCPISDDMKEAIGAMVRNNQNLLQMVNTLLEVYRFEAGQKKLALSPFKLPDLAHEVINELQPLAQEKALTLQLDCHPLVDSAEHREGMLVGDRLEIRRLLTNLLGNAIKFTDTGSIHVRLRPESLQSSPWLAIEVQDTGSGIPIDDQMWVFDRYRHGKDRRAGSGLGLYLARYIVEAHQGMIELQSQLGQGSLFTVRLPLQPSSKVESALG
jgi:two-component system, sensor histidine kinase and response regulator